MEITMFELAVAVKAMRVAERACRAAGEVDEASGLGRDVDAGDGESGGDVSGGGSALAAVQVE